MNKERLIKLAVHLEGKIGHELFDFSVLNTGNEPRCGTAGCALGECPIAFPNEWRFDFDGEPLLATHSLGDAFRDAEDFFDIDVRASGHLFYPHDQYLEIFGGQRLLESATKEQVAANIRAFVAKMEAKELLDA